MPRLFVLLFLLFSGTLFAQKTLHGTVLDASTGAALPGASVFLSNTSVGTTANSRGEFELPFPAGKYDLVVSAIDYETHSQSLSQSELPTSLVIRLKAKSKELAGIVIQPFEKDGWKKWGSFFLENFMGTSEEAQRCRILNKEKLHFRLDRIRNQLVAIAHEPLLIENKALGYRITYVLEDFHYDFSSRYVTYSGYPLYEDLDAGKGRTRKWARARKAVYQGSMMHFMRALYRNTLIEEGFTAYRVRKIPDLARVATVQKLEQGRLFVLDNGTQVRSDQPDSVLRFYQPQLARERVLTIVDGHRLSGDSLAFAVENTKAGLYFPDYVTVLYDRGVTPEAYRKTVLNGNFAMQSELTLMTGSTVVVESNGLYMPVNELLSNGWWGWSEKVGRMLPLDYEPE